MTNSRVKTKLQNSIMASKIEFDNPSESVRFQIAKQLSNIDVSVYHMESLYRNNSYDKYELGSNFCNRIISQNTPYTNS